MKNVLLPTDFSDNAWNAIEYALKLFKDTECTFYLLHVLPPTLGERKRSATGATRSMLSQAESQNVEKLEALTKKAEKLDSNSKHSFKTLSCFELFTDAVEEIVADKNIDIVILGSRGAGGIKEFFLGSNTSNLIGSVKCPILAIPRGLEFHPIREIGFATDYSFAYNKNGLASVFRIAEKFDAHIRIYHVMEKKDEWNEEKQQVQDAVKKVFEDYNTSFHTLTDAPLDVATRLFVESREIDLLCMAAEKYNFITSLLGKSPVKTISYHSRTPLLILHKDTLK